MGSIAVNKFLWQAAIDTLTFMTIKTADPQKGRIVTDWYIDKQHPTKRVRVGVLIIGVELRADAIKVFIDRQALNGRKQWIQSPISEVDRAKLEVLILERARKLKRIFIAEKIPPQAQK